jgi:hypothetical protein
MTPGLEAQTLPWAFHRSNVRGRLKPLLDECIDLWQRCQISRLFHEDAQGAQVIDLIILPG